MTLFRRALTSAQSSLRVEDVASQSDRLGHHLPVEGHSLGVVQGVAHQRGAEHVLHGLPQVGLVAHQGQGCVDVVGPDLTEEGGKRREEDIQRLNVAAARAACGPLTRLLAALITLSSRVLAEILFRGMMVYLRCSSPFSSSFLPVTCRDNTTSWRRCSTGSRATTTTCSHTHLCVHDDVVEPPSGHHLQGRGVGHVLDRDQVGQQALHPAVVPAVLRVPVRRRSTLELSSRPEATP